MCGISGFVDFNKKSDKNILKSMTDVLHHRGPDDSGYLFEQLDSCNLGFGHRRLSILDLSKHGHQPMFYDNLVITYNGEIYNFSEIKLELEESGDEFISNSDTEVILHSFKKWGKEAVHKFNGMFVFAIWDKSLNKINIYRDRAGVKPLYWYFKNGLLMFSSELKSFHEHKNFVKEINTDALVLYLQYGYILQPYTIFKDTHKLRAGHYLEINLENKEIKENKYWDVIDFYNKPKLNVTEEEAIEHIEELLKSSFEYRMVSDVPVGVFLSGGYDSSIVTAILQKNRKEKIKTFTIGFHEKGFDEAPYAKKVAEILGTEHTEYYCTQKDALEILPKLPKMYDEPFGDSSAIPTALVSKLAREQVTVSLSADGGDEIFMGYNKYPMVLKYYNYFFKIPRFIKPVIVKIMEKINPEYIPLWNKIYEHERKYEKIKNILKLNDSIGILKFFSQVFVNKHVYSLFKSSIIELKTDFDLNSLKEKDEINKILAVDYKTYMVDDILTKVDRATMSVSLEGREPMLDYRLIEYMAQLPSSLKYKNKIKKYLLKKITHKYLPKGLMDRKKMGFGVPVIEWFKDELKEYFLKYLNEERLKTEGFFNVNEIIKLRDDYFNGNKQNITKLWFLLMFEMWYEEWM